MTVFTQLIDIKQQYQVLYCDPPWWYAYGGTDSDQRAGKHYNQMTFEELAALPVPEVIAKPGVLFCWATGPLLDQAIDLLRAWKLHYRGVAYVWIKTAQDGHVIEGQGVRPSIVKSLDEFVLVASTQARGRPLPLLTESQGQNVLAPRGAHSEKPDEVRWRIEELFGDEVTRLEMFARAKYPGWDQFGNEADGALPASEARSPKLMARLTEQEHYRASMNLLDDLDQL